MKTHLTTARDVMKLNKLYICGVSNINGSIIGSGYRNVTVVSATSTEASLAVGTEMVTVVSATSTEASLAVGTEMVTVVSVTSTEVSIVVASKVQLD